MTDITNALAPAQWTARIAQRYADAGESYADFLATVGTKALNDRDYESWFRATPVLGFRATWADATAMPVTDAEAESVFEFWQRDTTPARAWARLEELERRRFDRICEEAWRCARHSYNRALRANCSLIVELASFDPAERNVPPWRRGARGLAAAIIDGRREWPRDLLAWRRVQEEKWIHDGASRPPWLDDDGGGTGMARTVKSCASRLRALLSILKTHGASRSRPRR